MTDNIYSQETSEYAEKNPNWHIEDSPWKAVQIMKMIDRNKLQPNTICEIGCGAGEILNQLHSNLSNKKIEFSGYDIAPDAINMSRERVKPRLNFYQENLLDKDVHFDLLLMIDVFEHVDDYRGFIKQSSQKATYKIYHIPLDMSVVGLIRNMPAKFRKSVGHLHYFMKETALATLTDCGEEVVDFFYTKGSIEVSNKSLQAKLLNIPRKLFFNVNQDMTVRLLGGYSLLVLTK